MKMDLKRIPEQAKAYPEHLEKVYYSVHVTRVCVSHCLCTLTVKSCVHILDIKSGMFTVGHVLWQVCNFLSTPVCDISGHEYQVSAKVRSDHRHSVGISAVCCPSGNVRPRFPTCTQAICS